MNQLYLTTSEEPSGPDGISKPDTVHNLKSKPKARTAITKEWSQTIWCMSGEPVIQMKKI